MFNRDFDVLFPLLLQTLELRAFLKSLGAEISEENAETGILTDLKNIIEASSICWKEINSDAGMLIQ